MHLCTTIARRNLAHARVLASSFLRHHPDGSVVTLIVDLLPEDKPESREPFTVMTPFDLSLEAESFYKMMTIYDGSELAEALKPVVLRTLIERHGEPVAYLDPHVAVFNPFEEAWSLAERHDVVLTPALLDPIPRDDLLVGEEIILRAGAINPGFMAVGPGAAEFLLWWEERMRWDARTDQGNGLFAAPGWLDLVPFLFDHTVIRDRGFNVAYWNLHERPLVAGDGRILAGGQPMRFFQFAGYDPDQPHLLAAQQGERPRILLSENPLLTQLCEGYRADLLDAGYRELRDTPYRHEISPGHPLDPLVRRMARHSFRHPDPGDEPPPPAFGPAGSDGFITWLNEVVAVADGAPVTRLVRAEWGSRMDLQAVFPHPDGPDGLRLMAWAAEDKWFQERCGALHRPPAPRATDQRQTRAPGFNVIGYFNAELGVGESARLLTRVLEDAGLPVSSLGYRRTNSRLEEPFTTLGPAGASYDVNVFCINADQIPQMTIDLGPEITDSRYRVGYWYWELPDFPPHLHTAFKYVDEIWVASEFVRAAIQASTSKPVRVMPIPVVVGAPTSLRRVDVQLPEDRFVYSFSFDYFSVYGRKNPGAIVEAYRRAFGPHDGTHLFIKSVNGHRRRRDRELLRWLAAGRPDITLHDGYFSSQQMAAIAQLTDCYVSLHRSEGFGLGMASAMAHGKPVIGTGWSGNVDFMDSSNSLLVPYRLVPVGPGNEPYQSDSSWAEPDVDVAAQMMRSVFDDPGFARKLGERARAAVATTHGSEVSAGQLCSWLKEAMSDGRIAGGSHARALPEGVDGRD